MFKVKAVLLDKMNLTLEEPRSEIGSITRETFKAVKSA
jgi:hypothetical protein